MRKPDRHIAIDLKQIGNTTDQLNWLIKNIDIIDLELSSHLIEEAHRDINVNLGIKLYENSLTFFLNSINKRSFKEHKFDKFLSFKQKDESITIDDPDNLSINPEDIFMETGDKTRYSYPLFDSILNVYGVEESDYDTCIIRFYNATVEGNNTIVFNMKHPNIHPVAPSPNYDASGTLP